MIDLRQGDCLELMKDIPDGSIDLIVCDLPYGTIGGMGKGIKKYERLEQSEKWDTQLDMGKMFTEYERILRENGNIILFSQEPYTSKLRTYKQDNIEFAYPLIWKKDHFANCLFSKKAPVNYFEDLSVFYKKYDTNNCNELRIYFKELKKHINKNKKEIIEILGQKADHTFRIDSMQFKICTEETYNEMIEKLNINEWQEFKSYDELKNINKKYDRVFNLPKNSKIKSNVLEYKKDYQGLHPTQKPIALLEDLIKTYSNKDDIVLDNCMGSGSTGVACVNTNRNFIGIEIDENYFNIAKERINNIVRKD